MSGTHSGGLKTAQTIRELYGEDHYRLIGQKGGQVKTPKGFALQPKWKISEAGAKGGRISRRGEHAV
jgi:general stress protein YciG